MKIPFVPQREHCILPLKRSVEEGDIGGKIGSDVLPDVASRHYQDVRFSQNVTLKCILILRPS
jgi:hypothetical protein